MTCSNICTPFANWSPNSSRAFSRTAHWPRADS